MENKVLLPTRRIIRLRNYDYAKNGFYFVTILCNHRQKLFGAIQKLPDNPIPQMILNEAGKIAQACWMEIPEHHPQVIIHEFVIMPDHIHGIIELANQNIQESIFAADSFPINKTCNDSTNNSKAQTDSRCPEDDTIKKTNQTSNFYNSRFSSNSSYSPNTKQPSHRNFRTLGSIIRGFKIGVTKWFRKNTNIHTPWQRSYYDRIIRSQKAYNRVTLYIKNNPRAWYNKTHHLRKNTHRPTRLRPIQLRPR